MSVSNMRDYNSKGISAGFAPINRAIFRGYRFAYPRYTCCVAKSSRTYGITEIRIEFCMPNPWDRPPWPHESEDECEPIYLAVGHALSQWADVEECISDLFVFFVGQEEEAESPAVRAYTSIDGVRNRIAMVRSAADAWFERFPDCSLKESTFDALKVYLEWSYRRNEIAHGTTDLPVDTPDATWFLYPGYLTKRRRTSRNNAEFRYNADQIEKMADGFENFERKLWELIGTLRAWRSEKRN